jgi:hypothetical protein
MTQIDDVRKIFNEFDWTVRGLRVDLKGYEVKGQPQYVTLVLYRDNYDALPGTTRLIVAERSLILRQLIQNTGMRCELEVIDYVPGRDESYTS